MKTLTLTLTQLKQETRKEAHIDMLRAQIKPLIAALPVVKTEMARAKSASKMNAKVTASISSSYFVSLSIYITLSSLTSLKTDPRLLKALERYAGEEWKAETSDYTYGAAPERSFHFNRREPLGENFLPAHLRARAEKLSVYIPYTLDIQVIINALVKSDSPTCRIVTTGTKEVTRIEDVKEIVCE